MQKIEPRQYSGAELLLPQAESAYEVEHYDLSESICLRLLEKEPDHAGANNLMHLLLSKKKKYPLALRFLAKAIEKEPDKALYHLNLALLLVEMQEFEKALMACDKAISLRSDLMGAYFAKVDIYIEQGDFEQAKNVYDKALGIAPDHEALHNRLGNLHAILGNFEEALNAFKSALRINPNSAPARANIASLSTNTVDTKNVALMEDLLNSDALRKEEKIPLLFGLGKEYEKSGDYDRAFEFFSSANALERNNTSYDVYETVETFQQIKERFSERFFQKHMDSGYRDKTPIFVLGMPRSGTTLTEQILSSHSQVFGAGELSHLGKLIHQGLLAGQERAFPISLKPLSNKLLEQVGSCYLEKLRNYSESADYITDKMPGNFIYVGLIKTILPDAKVIYCKREPADICLSIYKNYFNENHQYATDLKDLGIYCRHFRSLMEHWDEVLPGFMHTVVYEKMITDQQGETQKLLEFCGLPWEEACLSFHEKKRPIRTMSLMQVRKPIYSSSSGLWRQYEKHLRPLLEALQKPVDKAYSHA